MSGPVSPGSNSVLIKPGRQKIPAFGVLCRVLGVCGPGGLSRSRVAINESVMSSFFVCVPVERSNLRRRGVPGLLRFGPCRGASSAGAWLSPGLRRLAAAFSACLPAFCVMIHMLATSAVVMLRSPVRVLSGSAYDLGDVDKALSLLAREPDCRCDGDYQTCSDARILRECSAVGRPPGFTFHMRSMRGPPGDLRVALCRACRNGQRGDQSWADRLRDIERCSL